MPRTKAKPTQSTNATTPTATAPARPAEPVKVLTLAETAAYLRVPEANVLQLVSTQGLPGRKIGEDWRFLKAALQNWLSAPAGKKGLLSQIGALKDDPHREEMLRDIYQRRGRPETEEA
jgi:excisionase family DNA binding protein